MADAKTKVNYTEEMVQMILEMYAEKGNEGIEEIAQAVGRPVRSVRAKLVREGVYVAPTKPVKAAREEGPTKKELLAQLEGVFPGDVLDGLMPATKAAIQAVIDLAGRLAEAEQAAAAEDESAE